MADALEWYVDLARRETVVFLAVLFIFGGLPAMVASMKRLSAVVWFIAGMLLGPLALLAVSVWPSGAGTRRAKSRHGFAPRR